MIFHFLKQLRYNKHPNWSKTYIAPNPHKHILHLRRTWEEFQNHLPLACDLLSSLMFILLSFSKTIKSADYCLKIIYRKYLQIDSFNKPVLSFNIDERQSSIIPSGRTWTLTKNSISFHCLSFNNRNTR